MVAKEKINLLDVIPCRSNHITTVTQGEEMRLSFPRFKHEWMRRFLLPKGMSADIQIALEEHGAAVWKLIDGVRSTSEIVEALAGYFDREEGYERRVTAYLMQLQKDGFVRFKVRQAL